jgi:hypothetical protein
MSLGDGLVVLFPDDFELLRFDLDFALELHLDLLHLLVLVLLLQVHFQDRGLVLLACALELDEEAPELHLQTLRFRTLHRTAAPAVRAEHYHNINSAVAISAVDLSFLLATGVSCLRFLLPREPGLGGGRNTAWVLGRGV